ncbi:hypothetical protein VTL71DRAFT_2260 [Oculimacula yallundae]|uniref:Uncharacterized protein n=1 Tax=Oculimacula yallundae TaxID=86028 RepID=A0ABR4C8D9_9HELO
MRFFAIFSTFVALAYAADKHCSCNGTGPGDYDSIINTSQCCVSGGTFDGYYCTTSDASVAAYTACCTEKKRGTTCL